MKERIEAEGDRQPALELEWFDRGEKAALARTAVVGPAGAPAFEGMVDEREDGDYSAVDIFALALDVASSSPGRRHATTGAVLISRGK